MLKDFINWVNNHGIVIVNDKENERFFSRPLTNAENSYMIENRMTVDMIVSWPVEKRAKAARKCRDFVENR